MCHPAPRACAALPYTVIIAYLDDAMRWTGAQNPSIDRLFAAIFQPADSFGRARHNDDIASIVKC